MPEFSPGEIRTAIAQMTNPTGKAFSYTAELYLGLLEAASSGEIAFFLAAGETRNISFPVAMPGIEGTYPVYLDVFSDSQLIGAYQAIEDVQLIPIAPVVDGEIISLTWDSPPPFIAGERHYLTMGLYNPTADEQMYTMQVYDNDMFLINGARRCAAYGTAELTLSSAFTPGSHTIRVEMDCQGIMVDQKTLSILVEEVTPPPGVIDGRFLSCYAWWEGEEHWWPIAYSNNWPAGIEITFWFSMKNEGDISAPFTVSFMGKSCKAYISPGESGSCSFKTAARAGSHSLNLYGDSKLVDSQEIEVILIEAGFKTLRTASSHGPPPLPLIRE